MNRFYKLVHMEVHRFRYALAGLMALTALIQIGVLIFTLLNEISNREEAALRHETLTSNNVSFPGAKLSFMQAIFNTPFWFTVPVLLCAAALVLYVFVIWYRDWAGKDTFIYRLLMLPAARHHIYLAKLTAILLFVFGLVSFQLLLLLAENALFRLIVPSGMREASVFADAIEANQALAVLLPHRFVDFLTYYGIGTLAVLALFTAVLLERSYRRIGIVYGVVYVIACFVAVILPMFVLGLDNTHAYLYPGEIAAIELAVIGVVAAGSIWLGFRLLARKITV